MNCTLVSDFPCGRSRAQLPQNRLPFSLITLVCRSNLASLSKTHVYNLQFYLTKSHKNIQSSSNWKQIHRNCCICLKGALNPISKHLHQVNRRTFCSPFTGVSERWPAVHPLKITASKHSRTSHEKWSKTVRFNQSKTTKKRLTASCIHVSLNANKLQVYSFNSHSACIKKQVNEMLIGNTPFPLTNLIDGLIEVCDQTSAQ